MSIGMKLLGAAFGAAVLVLLGSEKKPKRRKKPTPIPPGYRNLTDAELERIRKSMQKQATFGMMYGRGMSVLERLGQHGSPIDATDLPQAMEKFLRGFAVETGRISSSRENRSQIPKSEAQKLEREGVMRTVRNSMVQASNADLIHMDYHPSSGVTCMDFARAEELIGAYS